MIKIFAIDKNQNNLHTLRSLIGKNFPTATFIAASGKDPLFELIDSTGPQLIFLEISAQNNGGLKTLRKLKNETKTCQIPVIALTAKKFGENIGTKAMEEGAAGFISQPVHEAELVAQINRLKDARKVNSKKHENDERIEKLVLTRTKNLQHELLKREKAEEKLKKAVETAKEQEKFSRIISKISTDLIDASLENIDQKIQKSLSVIGRYASADRSFIFLFKENSALMDNTHEWCAATVPPNIENFKDMPVSMQSWWMKKLLKNQPVRISNVKNLSVGQAREKQTLSERNIVSLLVVPIFKGSEILGFLGLNSEKDEKQWEEFHVQIIRGVANLMASALISVRNQNQLLRAKEKAEESDRLKSAFLANMSHEIRTPINGILGFLDLLYDSNISTSEQKQYFSMVRKSSDRLLTTINDIIEISKIESGQTPVIYSVENVNEIMQYLYHIFQSEAEEKGLSFRIAETAKNENKKVAIKTDKLKLESILKNLIKNAIKYTIEGKVEFGYQVEDDTITFCISDTGPGIVNEKINLIFNHFEQADPEITRHYEGAGLGLSITRAYAEMLRGKIRVESEPGKGSKFYFSLNHGSVIKTS